MNSYNSHYFLGIPILNRQWLESQLEMSRRPPLTNQPRDVSTNARSSGVGHGFRYRVATVDADTASATSGLNPTTMRRVGDALRKDGE